MANPDWLLIFRSYSTDELFALRDKLKAQITVLSSQSVGTKSLTRDLRELRDQLSSLTYVIQEKGGACNPPHVIVDFSGGSSGRPAGTSEPL